MEKLLTITGTGRAIVNTPASAHNAPTNIPTSASHAAASKQPTKLLISDIAADGVKRSRTYSRIAKETGKHFGDLFRVVNQTRKHDDTEHEEEHQQRQLPGRRLERVDQDAQAGRVARQLEQPQDTHDRKRFQQPRLFAHPLADVGVEAQGGRQIDDVDGRFDKLDDVWCHLRALETMRPVRWVVVSGGAAEAGCLAVWALAVVVVVVVVVVEVPVVAVPEALLVVVLVDDP
uniref:Uncharacterized protein n=1 Tax=Anopheles farauti TaxID=69004 RepID=A0A182QN90_9DIPT